MRNDDIGAESDKFLGVLLGTIASPVGIAKLDLDVFTIGVAEGVQTAPECIGERMRRRRGHQHSNKGEFSWSLCARSKRPRRSDSAEQRNELPSPHGHSLHARITRLTTSHTLPHRRIAVLCISAFCPPDFRNGSNSAEDLESLFKADMAMPERNVKCQLETWLAGAAAQ